MLQRVCPQEFPEQELPVGDAVYHVIVPFARQLDSVWPCHVSCPSCRLCAGGKEDISSAKPNCLKIVSKISHAIRVFQRACLQRNCRAPNGLSPRVRPRVRQGVGGRVEGFTRGGAKRRRGRAGSSEGSVPNAIPTSSFARFGCSEGSVPTSSVHTSSPTSSSSQNAAEKISKRAARSWRGQTLRESCSRKPEVAGVPKEGSVPIAIPIAIEGRVCPHCDPLLCAKRICKAVFAGLVRLQSS